MASRAFTAGDVERKHGADNRVWFRTRTIYRLVTVRVKGRQGFGRVRNISDGGICLETPVQVSHSDRVEIYFTNELSLRGRVAWSVGGDCGIQFDVPVSCRDLLAEATHRCIHGAGEPLTLRINASVVLTTNSGAVRTTLREVSPLCLRLDPRPELCAGWSGTITMPSGASRRGVVRQVDGNACTFLLCTPLTADEVGQFSTTLNHDNMN